MGLCTIRLDDITPDMNWENFLRIKKLFYQYQIEPLIGVVPCNQDSLLHHQDKKEEFWNEMKKLQNTGWVIAQHGYEHLYETKHSGLLGLNPFSEFAGLSYERQYEKLKCGWEILQKEGICAKIFMAPGHTYDRNTLRALKTLGFQYVTDGYTSKSYLENGLIFIPCTLSKPAITKGIDTICLHTNHMTDEDFKELEQFFKQHKGYVKSFHEILQNIDPKKKNMWMKLQERNNLLKRKMKKKVATNTTIQDYFNKTNSTNKAMKLIKRMLGLPLLSIKLVFETKKK